MGFSIPIKVLADEVEKRQKATRGLLSQDAFKLVLEDAGEEGRVLLQNQNRVYREKLLLEVQQELLDRTVVRAREQAQQRSAVRVASLQMGLYFPHGADTPSVRDRQIPRNDQ